MKLEHMGQMLPETVQLIAGLIGLPKTVKLVEVLGGTTFPVSKNQTRMGEIRYQALVEVVGVDAADTLTRHFGGDALYVPRCAEALRYLRDRAICEEFDVESRKVGSNAAVNNLALKYKLTDRWIWEILKSTDCSESPQSALF